MAAWALVVNYQREFQDGARPAAERRKQKRIIYAGRLRLRLVQDRGAKELTKFVQENVANGALCVPTAGKPMMICRCWATRTNHWCLMETPKEPRLIFQ